MLIIENYYFIILHCVINLIDAFDLSIININLILCILQSYALDVAGDSNVMTPLFTDVLQCRTCDLVETHSTAPHYVESGHLLLCALHHSHPQGVEADLGRGEEDEC